MTGYQLIAIQNNLIFRAPLWDSHHFAATPGVIYQVVDIKTGLPLEVRTLKTEEDLEVWKDDELLLVLDGYFQQDMDARFEERQPLLETGPFEEAGELVALDAEGNPVAEGTFSWLANAGYLAAGVVGMQAMAIGGSDELPDVTRDVTVTPLAGPFISEVDVKIYDADGNLMGTGSVDESTGQVTITISNGYVGPILVVVTDINGSDADYISEATGEATSLNGSLRAMMEVTGDGDVSLSVTPLTELAVQLAGVPDTTAELASSPITSEQVATNDSVEELLGVSDILGEATTVVDDDFNADDGLDDAETYGDMLAIFSGAEEDLGGIQASVQALAAEITLTEGTAQLSAAGASILQSGWQTFESGSNADLVETQSLVADMPLIAESQFGMLLNEASDGTTIEVSGVSEGDVIHTSLGSTSEDYTVTAEMLDGDVASVFIDTVTLQAAGDGELELQVQVNDETPRQPILIEQDLTPPQVLITLASSSLAVGETTQVTFTFSEAVEGFSADDIQVDNGTLTALTSSEDGLTWTALYVPDSDVENAAANISVLPAFTDLLGNAPASFTPAGGANPVAAQSAVSVDTSRPTALISLSDTDLALGETATVTISFSEAIAGFSLDDIEVDLALLSNLSSADGGTTWTATLTPQDGFESASNSVRLGIGWTDAAGNQPLVFYTSESYQVDTAAPRIDNSSYFSLAENSGAGQTLLTVSATDLQAVTWTLEGDHASAFSYNSSTGAVSLNDDPDYETLSLYQLTLVATDASGNRSEHSVVLEITDVDDSAPVFDSGDSARTIDENGPAEVVYTASTDDPNATFTLSGTDAAFFSLHGADVTFAGSANYETKDSYQFSITATDAAGNSSTQTVTMAVNDLDEVAPVFTSGTTATAVDENGPATVVYTATSDDASVTYSLSGTDAAAFSIADGVVTFNGNADYETQSSYSFTVTATDAAGNSSDQTVTMAVNDLDEVAPVFTSGDTATAVDENGAATVVYTATSDDANATYTLGGTDAASFSIADGVVTFNGSADYETQSSYSFTVTATDAAGNSTDQTVTMAVNDPEEGLFEITSALTADDLAENTEVTQAVYTATSSRSEATFSLAAGVDDSDLFSINASTGVVTLNNPADHETQASYSFTVVATFDGETVDQSVSLTILDQDDSAPVFTHIADLGFVVTWDSYGQDGSNYGIYAQRYAADGLVLGDEFRVNTTTANSQYNPVVTMLANGGFVISWQSDEQDGSDDGIYAQVYNADGTTSDDEFQVNQDGAYSQFSPEITALAGGGFVVVWQTTSAGEGNNVEGQIYDAAGRPVGDNFTLGAIEGINLDSHQDYPLVSATSDGGFWLVWSDYTSSLQRYDANGDLVSLSDTASLPYSDPDAIATLADDSLVLIYTGYYNSSYGTYSQRIDSTGELIGNLTTLSTASRYIYSQYSDDVAVTVLENGGYAVVWAEQTYNSGYTYRVYTQAFDADGTAISSPTTLDSGSSYYGDPTITSTSDGGYLVTWTTNDQTSSDTSGNAVEGQRFDADGNMVGDQFLVNTYTSSDQRRPDMDSWQFDALVVDLDEHSGAGQVVYTAVVTDTADEDDSTDTSASVTLQLLGTDAALFSLDAATGQVTLIADPNHETQASYELVIRATDAAGNQTDQAIQVVINNQDEQAPAFTSASSVSIDENIGTGQLVHTASADDSADYSQGVTFSLQATPGSEADLSAFEIDAETGELRLIANPDYETQSSYAVTLVATDAAGFVTTQAFTLNVNDLTELSPLSLSLDENAGANQLVHTATGGVSYALTGTHADDFSIDTATGEIRFNDDANHEYQASYSATVLITDAQGTVTQQQLTLTIQDLDETAPEFSGLGDAEGGYVAAYEWARLSTSRISGLTVEESTTLGSFQAEKKTIGLSDGGYLVVAFDWSSYDVKAVRFDAQGDQVGDVFVVHQPNVDTDGYISYINYYDLMALDDGGFALVVQETSSAATEDRGLYLYLFNADMNPQGEVLHIGDDNAQYPQLELLPDGTSWLVYKSYEDDGTGNYSWSFYGQRLDADLQPTGALIDLAQLNDSSIYSLSSTILEDGTLALGWVESGGYVSGVGYVYSVQLQTFDSSGTALTTAIEVAQDVNTNYLDMVSLTNGNLVLAWQNDDGFVEAQVVNSQGVAISDLITNESPALYPGTAGQSYPSLVVLDGGNFALAWINDSGSDDTVLARHYDQNGDAISEIFEIDTDVLGSQYLDLANLRTTRHELDALDENVDAGTLVYAAAATDTADIDDATDTSAGITYALSGTDAAVFSVDAAGNVTLNTSPDYETQSSYEVELTATDAAGNARTLTLVLDINDLGDTAPVFTSDANPAVNENLANGSVVYTPTLDTVADSWSLSGTDAAMFSIDASTGVVTLNLADGDTLDHETLSAYEFVVTATNAFGSTNQTVTLSITDLDEAAPVITSSATTSIDEGSAVSSALYTATATDAADIDDSTDTSAGVVFSINGTDADAFNVDASTGAITLAEVPDYETQTSYSFNLVATDAAGNATSQAVTVSINNIDDTAPTFTSNSTLYVDENAGENKVVGTVTATDVDSDNATITYGIQQGTGDAASFSIDSSTGALTLIPDADYETDSSYYLYVTATDESGNSSSDYVQVQVNDVAENPPTVTSGATATSIEENNGVGEIVYRATADTAVTNFALSGADAGLFTIDSYGYVRTATVLNHEAQGQYNFTVTVSNEFGSTNQAVTLDLTDVDEQAPTITSGAFATDTQETAALGTTVYSATAVDEADIDDSTQSTSGISYSLGGDDASYFDINGSTGKVSLASGLDYESRQSYSFEVTATDAAGNSSTQQVSLTVLDVNEGPVFGSANSAYIAENVGTDQLVYTASATDADGSDGITYSMGTGGDSALFSIDASTGAVTLSENPDYETQSSYSFTVIAENAGGETTEKTVTLTVNDLAEDAPVFTSGSSVLVNENIADGSRVYSAATDTVADSFSLTGADAALFSIDALTGVVSLISSPDHETQSEYQFSVVATNQHGSNQQDITLTVRDLDESAPVFTSGDTASTLTENSGAGQTVYTAVATDTADLDDSTDTSGDLYYSLAEVDDYELFDINHDTGVVTLLGNPDYEANSSYSFTVVARDDGGNTATQQVSMAITDIDDTAPQFTSSYYGSVVDGFGASEVVYTATATDSDSLAAPTFSIKAGGDASLFSIDATSGELTLLENADLDIRSQYSLTLIATDESGHTSEHDIEIRIADPLEAPPIFTSATSVQQAENTEAGSTLYEADTNVAVDTFSLAGTDASYFSIDASTGVVTLNQALDHESQSTYSFTVVASNAGGVTQHDVTLTLSDVDESTPVYAETDVSVSIDENAAAYQTVYTTQATDTADTDDSTDASASLIYSLAGDDSGYFSIDGDSGEITFNASADHETQSSYSLTLIATDTGGNTAEQNLTLNINDLDESAPVFTSATSLDNVSDSTEAGTLVYSATATDTADIDSSANTSSGITYSLIGTDASAFSINASSGAVTINASPNYATQSSYSFTVIAEDAAGNQTEQALVLAVTQSDTTAPVFTSGTTATAVDENGSATVVYTATSDDANATYTLGGNDAASFSIADGVVTFNGSADYETQSSYSFTVIAEDYAGNTSNQTVTMVVNDLDEVAPVFTTGSTVSSLGNGGFVVTWESYNQDGDGLGIYGQRYDSDGNTVGSEFQINTYTSSTQHWSSVTTLMDGGFVVTWTSDGQDGDGNGIYGQRYDANGNTVGSEFQINSYTSSSQAAPSVTTLVDGGFVVSWNSYLQDGSDNGIYGQRYDANGNASGSEFQVNNYIADYQFKPDVASLENGGFVVTWSSYGQDGSGWGIYGQRYDADGNAAGSEFQINTYTSYSQYQPSVTGLLDGGFVVTWVSDDQDGSGAGIYGQRYDADGNTVGSEFQINTHTSDFQEYSSVTALLSGGFVVTWESDNQDGSGDGVYGQLFDADGNTVGSEFLINTYTSDDQYQPSVSALDNGGFVVTWASEQDGSGYGVYGQRFDADGNTVGSEFQVNTYTSDNQDEPDVAGFVNLFGGAISIDENSGANQVVYTANATDTLDDDTDNSANVTYSLGGTDAALFSLGETSGELTLLEDPDYETQSSYEVVITATDDSGNSSSQTVTIAVNDLDEAAPVFTSGTTATAVDENGAATVVYTATSDDANATYTLGGTDAAAFSIADGVVTFNGSADYETQSSYSFTVIAEDAAGNTSTQTVTMAVNDLDEVAPVFTSGTTAIAVDENGAATVVYTATSDDANATYTLGGTDAASFSIADGVVTFNGSADYETQSSYSFTVIAEDAAGNTSTQTVTMTVNDLDEVAPVFTSGDTATAVDENGAATLVYTASSDDANATYTLGGTDAAAFSIANGVVTFNGSADYETQSSYSFTVIAEDAAGNTSNQTVTMAVNDLDEVAPVFTSGATATAVDENGAATVVYTATSDDANATYTLGGTDAAAFSIANGVVTFNGSADYETKTSYSFTVTATDAAGNSTDQTVTMAVNDLSEGVPIFAEAVVNLTLDENSGALQLVHTATATDSDAAAQELVYSLSGDDAGLFELDAVSGELTLIDSPDYETQSSYSVTVTATDADGQSDSQVVNIAVTDLDLADEEAPVIDDQPQVTEIDENTGAGSTVYVPNEVESGLTYYLAGADADALTIDPNTGYVTINEAPDYETQSRYQFVVIAVDAAGNSQSETIEFEVTNQDEAEPTFWDAVVIENIGANQVVYQAATTDNEDISGGVTYSLKTGNLYKLDADANVIEVENDGAFFSIDEITGELTLLENPDFETRSSYSVSIVATDANGNSAERLVEIGVEDVTENSVLFDLVNGVSSLDSDDDRTFNADETYSIYMLVDSDSGEITMGDGQQWSGAENLGEDDQIILVGDGELPMFGTAYYSEGPGMYLTGTDESGNYDLTYEAVSVQGYESEYYWWSELQFSEVGNKDQEAPALMILSGNGNPDDGNDSLIVRYWNEGFDTAEWLEAGEQLDTSSINTGVEFEDVYLAQLPTSVEDELNWG